MKLYSITLPGLEVRTEWRLVHDRLLDDFSAIDEVLPTTMAGTILIVYRGRAQLEGWLESIEAAILGCRLMQKELRVAPAGGARLGTISRAR